MMVRRSLSGKHILLWLAALLALAGLIAVGAMLLRGLIRQPTLATETSSGEPSAERD